MKMWRLTNCDGWEKGNQDFPEPYQLKYAEDFLRRVFGSDASIEIEKKPSVLYTSFKIQYIDVFVTVPIELYRNFLIQIRELGFDYRSVNRVKNGEKLVAYKVSVKFYLTDWILENEYPR